MKKQLLNESEVRKLMKFANIGALAGNFVERINEEAEATPLDEEELEEAQVGPPDEEAPAPGGMTSPDAPMTADPDAPPEPEMTLDPELDDGAAAAGGTPEAVVPKVQALVDALDDVLVAAGLQPGMVSSQTEGDPGGDLPGELAAGGGEEMEVADVDVVDDEEAGPPVTTEGLVSEVARRVARRLRKLKS